MSIQLIRQTCLFDLYQFLTAHGFILVVWVSLTVSQPSRDMERFRN